MRDASGTVLTWYFFGYSHYWFRKGEKIFEGKYELLDSQLTLRGKLARHDHESTLRLVRKR